MDDIITGDIGGRLRRARQQRGLSLQDAAGRTKLSMSVLQAIERNDFESLPGGIYRKGYLRSLAGEVGLDPKEIVAEYDQEFAPVTTPAAVAHRTAVEDEWARQLTVSPRGSMVTLAILIALAIGWFAWPDGVEPALPATRVAGEPIPALAPIAAAASAVMHRASEPADKLAAPAQNEVPLRIEMAAIGWCWVAADGDGERVIYRLIEPGERVVLEAQRLISLRVGDAGAVTLSINDGPARTLGRDGEVVELEVTADTVEALRDAGAAAMPED